MNLVVGVGNGEDVTADYADVADEERGELRSLGCGVLIREIRVIRG